MSLSDPMERRSVTAESAADPPAPGRPAFDRTASGLAAGGGGLGSPAPGGDEDQPTSGAAAGALPSSADLLLEHLEGDARKERRILRWALLVALVFHAVVLLVTFPSFQREPKFIGKPGKVFLMQQVRFQKPPAPPQSAQQQVPKKKAKRIPIPDPTPDDPEPILVEELVEVPDLDPTEVDEFFPGIPEGPDPGAAGSADGVYDGAIQMGDGVQKPVAIHKPDPLFTEAARQARTQGVVILTGVIDENGDVRNLKLVKGLPLGLSESALETVRTWKYKPATLDGKPVAVYYHFTIGFWLQ